MQEIPFSYNDASESMQSSYSVIKPTPSLYTGSNAQIPMVSFTQQNIQPSSHVDSMNTMTTAITNVCLPTSLGKRSCDNQFQMDKECTDILQTGVIRNATSQLCPEQIEKHSKAIKTFFSILSAIKEMTPGCIKSLKW